MDISLPDTKYRLILMYLSILFQLQGVVYRYVSFSVGLWMTNEKGTEGMIVAYFKLLPQYYPIRIEGNQVLQVRFKPGLCLNPGPSRHEIDVLTFDGTSKLVPCPNECMGEWSNSFAHS
jgi:hypothetical protein